MADGRFIDRKCDRAAWKATGIHACDVHPHGLPRAAARLGSGGVLRGNRQERVGGAQHRAPVFGGERRVHLAREPLTFGDFGFEAGCFGVQLGRNVVHYTCWVRFETGEGLSVVNRGCCLGEMPVRGLFCGLLHELGNLRAGADVVVRETTPVELF